MFSDGHMVRIQVRAGGLPFSHRFLKVDFQNLSPVSLQAGLGGFFPGPGCSAPRELGLKGFLSLGSLVCAAPAFD